jgi:hypothetical protein
VSLTFVAILAEDTRARLKSKSSHSLSLSLSFFSCAIVHAVLVYLELSRQDQSGSGAGCSDPCFDHGKDIIKKVWKVIIWIHVALLCNSVVTIGDEFAASTSV